MIPSSTRRLFASPVRMGVLIVVTTVFLFTVGGFLSPMSTVQAANSNSVDFERDSSHYMTASDSTSLSVTGDMTLEAWVKFESIPPYDSAEMVIASKFDSGSDKRSFIFSQRNNGGSQYLSFIASSAGTGGTVKDVAWTPSTGTWYHVAAVYTASSGSVSFYVNGVQQGSTQTGLPTSIHDNDAAFTVGGSGTDGGYFDGKIDDLRIWNIVRTAQEILDDKSRELYGNEVGLVGYWKLNADSGLDSTANGNTLSGVNSPVDSLDTAFPGVTETLKVRKSANESVSDATSGITLQNDDALKLSLLANKTYIIDGVLFASSTSATPDIKIAFFGPTDSIITIGYTNDVNEAVLFSGATSTRIQLPANTPTSIHIKGTITTGGYSGDLQLKWAQVSGDNDATTVMRGSYLRADGI
ncbi:hypothetical protein COU18_01480 [Candidatus Kaiserbacteria bacterium CG10_big_fil_rev_8_21_14_0_10_51_14]|uniref:LamG-like jellyroll fold domain-containing protein n=1 Tax=Candidatus Kaiserbacteria bacterium CG10_big_fil_rev_8_21_14_0_10_51_14 TaxID=1974610 RepID=A0A2H0UCB1_9BACT|nr:MAG: hypothetical protein COU18_01480 [Candidatus Kaiserbacteria bacterium CG10_big_fil_rev_8_21_14_0_10_51_14]